MCTYWYLITYLDPFNALLNCYDSSYHHLRVEALKYNIENNNLFSGIDYLFFDGGGYAGFAYPSLFLYIPALFRVMGVGIGASMSLFILLCNAFSYFNMFLFLRKISKSTVCGTIGAVLYVLSTYRLDNIITRLGIGELLAFVFYPVILYGLYDFIFDNFKKPYILGLGFVGIILSHTISTALALGVCVLTSLIFLRRILKTPKRLLKLLITVGCVALATAYYWLPLLELLNSCEMAVEVPDFHVEKHALALADLFKESIEYEFAGLGFPIFLMLVPRVLLTRKSPIAKSYLRDKSTQKRKNILIAADAFAILGVFLALMTTDVAPWGILTKFLNFMQFPNRLFAPATILLITAGTIYLYYIVKYTKAQKIAMVAVTAVAIVIAAFHSNVAGINHTERPADYYSRPGTTYSIGMGEWLPQAAKNNDKNGVETVRQLQDNVLLNNGTKIPCERQNGTLTFDLGKNEGVDFVKLPYIWYKGYEAKDENGNELIVSMSDNGLVQVDLQGASGKITVEHKPTAIRIVSYFISLLSIIAMITLFVISRFKALPRKPRREKAEAM